MLKSFFICLFAITSLHAQTDSLKWASQYKGNAQGEGLDVVVDRLGNVYTTGIFTGEIDVDPGPGQLTMKAESGEIFTYIVKADAAGVLVWAKFLGDTFGSVRSTSIALDQQGNVFISGAYRGTIDFDPGPNKFDYTSYTEALFVLKLDACGDFKWAKEVGGSANDRTTANAIAIDQSGNVYITGSFSSKNIDFDPGGGEFYLTSQYQVAKIFLSKWTNNGDFVWAKQMAAETDVTGQYGSTGNAATVDKSGNIYITGHFAGKVDFDPGPGQIYASAIDGNQFISKFDPSGNLSWASFPEPQSSSLVWGNSIKVDGNGNVYTSGAFWGTVDFHNGAGVFDLTAAYNGQYEMFNYVYKLSSAGKFVWAAKLGGIGDFAKSFAILAYRSTLDLDAGANVFITGSFSGTFDADPGPAVYNMAKPAQKNVFIVNLDTDGKFISALQFEGLGSAYATAIVVDASKNIHLTGSFTGTNDFDPGQPEHSFTSDYVSDVFVEKLSNCNGQSTTSNIDIVTYGSYNYDCQVYTTSGDYSYTYNNVYGCDSIIKLHITIKPPPLTNLQVEACKSYSWNGQLITVSGTYSDTLKTAGGVDSIVILKLSIKPSTEKTVDTTICEGQFYEAYGTTGTYVNSYLMANGCDSIRTLRLTVLPKPLPALGPDRKICAGDVITLYPGSFSSYLWQNGSASDKQVITEPGAYSITVTNTCGSGTDEVIVGEGSCAIFFPTAFTPNNDGKNDLFKMLGDRQMQVYRLLVYNRWGHKIFETNDPLAGWNGKYNQRDLDAGNYVWVCEYIPSTSPERKILRGNIFLIR